VQPGSSEKEQTWRCGDNKSGMGAGTKRWSGMAESSGKRDKSEAPCVGLRPQMSYVGKADLNGLALVNGQLCRSGSPEGGVFAPLV
jgi:hypothetical protein